MDPAKRASAARAAPAAACRISHLRWRHDCRTSMARRLRRGLVMASRPADATSESARDHSPPVIAVERASRDSRWPSPSAARTRRHAVTSGLLFLAAVAAAVVFRMLLPPAQRTNESSDYRDFYAPVAQQILAGSGPTVPDSGGPAVRYPPGYPALLAAAFAIARGVGVTDERGAIVLGVLAAGVVAALLERIASAAWEPRIAWVAGLAWLTYPLALWLTKQPCSELPFMVLLVAAVGLAWRALHGARPAASCAMAGGLVGLAMLVRPIAIGTGVVLGAALVLAGRGWKRLRARVALGTLLVLASIVTVLPWELWVYERTGRVVALSTAGVSSIADGLLLTDTTKEYRHVAGVPSDVAAV